MNEKRISSVKQRAIKGPQGGNFMNQKARVSRFFIFFLISIIFLLVSHSEAQDYPKSVVQIVIQSPPGETVDIFWRTIVDTLNKHLNGTIALVNKAGGGGVIATAAVANSKADGYTLLAGTSDPLNIAPILTPGITYDTEKDLTYIAKLAVFPQVIAVRAESPYKSLEDLIAGALSNPGKLKAGLAGMVNTSYFGIKMLNLDAKVDIVAVPFGGGGELVSNLLGGHIDLGFLSVSPIKAHFEAGKVRILAVLSATRLPNHPQIPTTMEKGLSRTVISTGIGLLGPAGLSVPLVKKWEDVAETTMKDPKIVSTLQRLDYVIDFKRGVDFKKEILKDYANFKEIIEKSGIKK